MSRKIEITTLRSMSCADRHTCPGIHALADRPGRKYVILTAATDPDELAAFAEHMGPGEILGYGPDELFEGVV